MRISCDVLVDKGFDVLFAAPLGVLAMYAYSHIWGFFSWPAIAAFCLVLASGVSFVEFSRYEKRRAARRIPGWESSVGIPKTEEEEKQTLIGAWFVTNDYKYLARWRFHPNGSAESMFVHGSQGKEDGTYGRGQGTWKLDGDVVRVTMKGIDPRTNEPYWFTLARPITATGVCFGTSQNPKAHFAIKLFSDHPPPV